MRTIIKRTATILLCVLLLFGTCMPVFAAADTSLSWLHTEGEQIVDADGKPVVLRGTNFGGWGIMEDWFCPFTDPAGEDNIYETLVSRFG